ncbi:MAG: glutathione S-transferase N-terminal domain-containing protein [Gammaproteobacteria bacterium]|nr:glutathione S-transferase N-terminal domain-containing protein [Gammaproteobacteria bacterium]
MIDLYYWPTPNGHKVSIMLEESGLEYRSHPVNILKGEQFEPEFLRISPNNRIPAIVDQDGPGGEPFPLFESGAILMYLAEKSGRLWPTDASARYRVTEWLMFQVANVGPKFGECGHYHGYAPEPVPYSIERYYSETQRLYGVLDNRLGDVEYLAGDYSIADIAVFPWMAPVVRELHKIDVDEFPNVKRWLDAISARPAVQRGMALLEADMKIGDPSDETREAFFGDSQYQRR